MTAARLDLSLEELEEAIGYRFSNKALLKEALSHRSWASEARQGAKEPAVSNERLEFLGDAILQLVVTVHIYKNYRSLSEGELAKVRAAVVSSATLAELADELSLGRHVLLGRGEEASGGREKPSILADAMEALIGAVYLDGGWKSAEVLVMQLVRERIERAAQGPGGRDYKTRLQEYSLQQGWGLPQYSVDDEGPDHAKKFRASVTVGGSRLGSGEGRSKKQAEQAAARAALETLDTSGKTDDA
jgi:ribonuclease-3